MVRPSDILFHMGDFCLNTSIEKFEDYIGRIRCQNIRLLQGNHNNPHERKVLLPLVESILGDSYRNGSMVTPARYKNVIFNGHYLEVAIDGQMIVLFHYPIGSWNEMSNASWHLCGHSHYNYDLSTAENKEGKILDVGWDGHKKALTMEEIQAIMATKAIPVVDHHM
jgi:calcineurin-like phosphoesterase family protein